MLAEKQCIVFLSACCAGTFFAYDVAHAANWKLKSAISTSYTQTDNINLSLSNTTSDTALSVNPTIQLDGKGKRIDLAANYSLNVIRFRDNREVNTENHSASIAANFKLVPDTFNIETNVRYGQRAVSTTTAPVPEDDIFITDNRTDTLVYNIRPVYRSRLGGAAQLQADYNYEGVQHDNDTVTEQDVRNAYYHLGLSKQLSNFTLSFDYNKSEFNINREGNDSHSQTNVGLRYQVTPKLSLIANGGDEKNRIDGTLLGDGDSFWSAGFIWQPNARTSIEVTRGERFFGDTAAATITHNGKRSRFTLSYDESITTTSAIEADTDLIPGFVVFTIVNDVVLQEALHITLSGKTPKTEYGVNIDKRNITTQVTLDREEFNATTLFWNWRFSPRSSIRLSGKRQQSDFISTNREDVLTSQEVSYKLAIGRRSSAGLRYAHFENKSSAGTNEYESNLYAITITWNFK